MVLRGLIGRGEHEVDVTMCDVTRERELREGRELYRYKKARSSWDLLRRGWFSSETFDRRHLTGADIVAFTAVEIRNSSFIHHLDDLQPWGKHQHHGSHSSP